MGLINSYNKCILFNLLTVFLILEVIINKSKSISNNFFSFLKVFEFKKGIFSFVHCTTNLCICVHCNMHQKEIDN